MRLRRGRLRWSAALAAVLLLPGCGLPLPEGVQTPGQVPDQQPQVRDISVLPPGPAPDATEREIVEGFLRAQTSSADDRAVARSFLAPGVVWAAERNGVRVYDGSEPPELTQGPDGLVRVVSTQRARVGPDGAYTRTDGEIVDEYQVACPGGRCRITALPVGYGLRLTATDLALTYAPRTVHFLVPPPPGGSTRPWLAADLVWLPRGPGLAARLVHALVDGPSSALRDSVTSAVPPGTQVREVRAQADGTVTVDLTEQVRGLPDEARQHLSAQLVWTLRELDSGFTRLRLQAGGRVLAVDGTSRPQTAGAYQEFDPEWLRPRLGVLHLTDRRLAALDDDLAPSDATNGTLPVDEAAASPEGPLALLTQRGAGRVELRTGPRAGPFGRVELRGRLSSPTWGNGQQGLWLLQDGQIVVLTPEGGRVAVAAPGLEAYGAPAALRLSPDGVRAALLVGPPDDRRLLVGRLVREDGRPRILGLRQLVPRLAELTDVAWESGTSLVLLASFSGLGPGPGRVAVDGSASSLLDARLPLEVVPGSLAAAPGRPVVLAGLRDGRSYLFREEGAVFRQIRAGHGPFYPG